MTDWHVHIGQYENAYYYADRVFSALKAGGVNELWFSSTTSCLYCKEAALLRNDLPLLKNAPSAKELFASVKKEISDALRAAKEIGVTAHALYWVVPEIHFSNATSTSRAIKEIPYEGFKIHPFAQKWDLKDERTANLAERIFCLADKNKMRVLIHCGSDAFMSPRLFEQFIARYPSVQVQLAHCRPADDIIYMMQKYKNVSADISMASEGDIEKIKASGLGGRLLYGSDFPITHWRSERPKSDSSKEEIENFLLKNDFLAKKIIYYDCENKGAL